jgi:hypothetical protein
MNEGNWQYVISCKLLIINNKTNLKNFLTKGLALITMTLMENRAASFSQL